MIFSLISAVCLSVAFLPVLDLRHPFLAVFAVVSAEVFAALTAAAFEALCAFFGCQSSARHFLIPFPNSMNISQAIAAVPICHHAPPKMPTSAATNKAKNKAAKIVLIVICVFIVISSKFSF